MESSNFVMALVVTFIGAAILLAVGIQVLANVQNTTNCLSLPGGSHFGTGMGTGQGKTNTTATLVSNSQANSTGWAASCFSANGSIQNSYGLLIVIMVVIAAVAILAVVKLL